MLLKSTLKLLPKTLAVVLFTLVAACTDRNERLNESNHEEETDQHEVVVEDRKISKVIFFLENSGSLKGYVNGDTDFKTSVASLGHLPDFDRTEKSFYFISGQANNCKVDFITDSAENLDNGLNFQRYDEPNSDLTKMLEVALDSAQNYNISILITDGLYDVGDSDNPQNALEREVEETQETFRNKLENEDVETIIIKAYSNFKGDYYFVSKEGDENLNQQRPYYIFIFGKSQLLNKLRERNLKNEIKGFANMARFLKFDELNIPFQATRENKVGEFKFDKQDKNKLTDVRLDRNDQGFQFSFATDYSSLPYPDSYYENVDNYICSCNYIVTSVINVKDTIRIFEVRSFPPTHQITVFTSKSPYCELNISLKNVVPAWINNTNSVDESNINIDTTQTYGFKFLTDAISEAYSNKNKEKNITNFTFEIIK